MTLVVNGRFLPQRPGGLQRTARSLLEAGDGFRFDLSDLQPVAFGGTTGEGMWAELAAWVADPTDLAGTQRRLEEAAAAAWDE